LTTTHFPAEAGGDTLEQRNAMFSTAGLGTLENVFVINAAPDFVNLVSRCFGRTSA
jgi:hypothetical protein